MAKIHTHWQRIGMFGRIFGIFGLFLLLSMPNAHAANFTLNTPGNHELGQSIEYWQDNSEPTSLEKISQQNSWQPVLSDNINLGFSTSSYWFKTVINNQQTQLDWFILITYPPLDYINAYICSHEIITDAKKQCQVTSVGDRLPFEKRERFNPNYVIPVLLAEGNNYIYIEVLTEGSYQLPISLMDKQTLDNYLAVNDFLRGGYLTLMLAMMLYNLFIYFMTRSVTYLLYSGFVFTFALFHMSYEGSGYQFLWPQSPIFNQYAMPIAFAMNQIFTILFVVKFLNLKHVNRSNYYYFTVLLGFATFSLFLVPFTPYKIFIPFQNLLSIVITSSAFYLGLKYWRQNRSAARLFTIAWAFLITGIVTANLRILGILPSNFFTQYGYQVGSFIEIILLSLALGERIQRLQISRMHAKQDLVHEKHEKMLALHQLIAGVNHEMNTPIGNISLSNSFLADINNQLKSCDVKTLKESELLSQLEQQSMAINTIKSSTAALSGLTEIFRNININEENYIQGRFDLIAFISNKLEILEEKIVYKLNMPSQLIINSYPNAFDLIFDQLLSNSQDHFPEYKDKPLIVSINIKKSEERLIITFSDNGKGLSVKESERIFLPFYTTSRGSKKKLGLGMYQLKNIITDLLKGSIQSSTSKAGGLKLIIEIPIKKES
ncbi:MAG: signal transduction histidine kinase [Oleispira sp.]|jgi:signal transduction histidine kinase